MIEYPQHTLNLFSLFRLHGSALFQSALPALLSTICFYLWVDLGDKDIEDNTVEQPIYHPYAIGVLIVAFTFLITFRANLGYNRYWEAATAVHQMLSKWLDVSIQLAGFHRQSSKYDGIRPPAFGDHPNINLSCARTRKNITTPEQLEEQVTNLSERSLFSHHAKSLTLASIPVPSINARAHGYRDYSSTLSSPQKQDSNSPLSALERLHVTVKLDGGNKEKCPSLFLQECSHLMSLMAAVAMSTLRNDVEGCETPLIQHVPGSSWPPVDPDQLSPEIRKQFNEENSVLNTIRAFFGYSRNATVHTLYNAARPFKVLGGVSDAEIQLLQNARGPCAKVALCSLWMQEFISREYLGGSVGDVNAAILSRLIQEISDGMLLYNQARKVAYVPFPFPHAQMASIFTIIIMVFVPVIMFSFANELVFACFLNFFTVLCFEGVHQVARELENPFKNVPNDLPLTTFQAQFNEALITMYAGYHPESWWEVPQMSQKED